MAEFRIVVVVDPKGAIRGSKQVTGALNRTGQAADRTRALIARAFAFAGVAAGVRQLVTIANAFQNIQNRLRTVTNGQDQLNNSLSALEGVARRTRQGLDGIVTLYQRGAIAAGQLGITNERLIGFVEKVGQALAIQGASAATTRGALLQLSQALGSSIVRAEEFNSILEGAFPIAQAAAQGIDRAGGSVARLRQLILAGEVTSKQFFEGFEKGAQNLDATFKRTVPTIGQAFTVLANSITLFVGRLDSANGVSASFARAVIRFSGNLDTAARVAGTLAIVIGVVLVGALAKLAIGLVALALSNPFTAIALAATTAAAAVITFGDKLKVPGAEFANLQETAVAAFEVLGEEMAGVFNFLQKGAQTSIAFVQSKFLGLGLTFNDLSGIAKTAVNRIIGHFVGMARALSVVFDGLRKVFNTVVGSEFFQRLISGTKSVVNFAGRALSALAKSAKVLFGEIGDAAKGLSKKLGDDFKDNDVVKGALDFGTKVKDAYLSGLNQDFLGGIADTVGSRSLALIDKINARAETKALARIAREKAAAQAAEAAKRKGLGSTPGQIRDVADPAVEKFLKDLANETELLKLNSREREVRSQILKLETDLKRELTSVELANVDTQLRLNQALGIQAEEFDNIRGPMQSYEDRIAAINALLARPDGITSRQAADRIRELNIELLDTQTTTLAGFERGWLKAQKDVENFSTASERIISDAFAGATDVLTDFFMTGKLNAEDFFRTMAANFARMAAQAALAHAFGQGGSGIGDQGGGGSAVQGIGGLIASGISSYFSGGGGFKDGGSFLVGANTAQARIPGIDNRLVAFRAQDGEKVTVTPKNENGAGSGVVNQVFNIQTPDADSFQRSQTQIQNRANAGLSRARARR